MQSPAGWMCVILMAATVIALPLIERKIKKVTDERLVVLEEIAIQAVEKVEGATLPSSRSLLFDKQPVECVFKKNGDFIVTINIRVAYGSNVSEISKNVQEQVEHDLLYMTEIRPRKVHVNVADIK